MNIVESLRNDIDWSAKARTNPHTSDSDCLRAVLSNQESIMEALAVLLERSDDSCGACGGKGIEDHSAVGGMAYPCPICRGTGKRK